MAEGEERREVGGGVGGVGKVDEEAVERHGTVEIATGGGGGGGDGQVANGWHGAVARHGGRGAPPINFTW